MSPSDNSVTANRSALVGFSYVLLGALGFSAKAVLVKLAYQLSLSLDAITLMVLRMAMALPFFLIVSWWSSRKVTHAGENKLTRADKLMILGLGFLGYYLASLLDFKGLQLISAGLERLIIFLYPTLVVMFSALFLGKSITRGQIVALGISYLGMFLVFYEIVVLSESTEWLAGSVLVFLSAVSFAVFLMGSEVMVTRVGSTRFTAYSMTVACLATFVHFVVVHDVRLLALPGTVYWIALIMAVFSTVLPSFLMNAGIRRIGAGTAAQLSSFGPISTLALAYWLLNETVSLIQMLGTLLVLIGVGIVSRLKAK